MDDTINNYKKHTKKIKIPLKHLVEYKFYNSFISKEKSSTKIYEKNNINYDRSSFYRQEEQINLNFYEDLNRDISILCNNNLCNKHKNSYTFMAIDGMYGLGKNYDNFLNMGYFDITNDIPIEIDQIGIGKKNQEVGELIDKIKSDINLFKNKVIVVDRLYFSYKFIYFLIENKIKFIIRCKGNCKNLKLEKITKDKELIKLIKNNTRIITYYDSITRTLTIPNKSKKNKSKTTYTFSVNNDCTLITNLSNHFDNQSVLNFYRSRWNVETYFKLVKHNFNADHYVHKTETEIKKQFLCINIMCSICKVFNLYLTKDMKEKNADILDEYIIKCNETKLLDFIENIFLNDMLIKNEQLTFEKFTKDITKYKQIRKYKKMIQIQDNVKHHL